MTAHSYAAEYRASDIAQRRHDYARIRQQLNALAADAVASGLWAPDTDGDLVMSQFLTAEASYLCDVS